MLSTIGAVHNWCWPQLVLSTIGAGHNWCWPQLVLSTTGAVHNWCCPQLVLATIGAVHNWCCPQLVLSTTGACHNWCCPQLVLSTIFVRFHRTSTWDTRPDAALTLTGSTSAPVSSRRTVCCEQGTTWSSLSKTLLSYGPILSVRHCASYAVGDDTSVHCQYSPSHWRHINILSVLPFTLSVLLFTLTSHQYTVSTPLHTQPFNSSSQFSLETDTRAFRISRGSPTVMTPSVSWFSSFFRQNAGTAPHSGPASPPVTFFRTGSPLIVPTSDTVQPDRLTASSSGPLQCNAGCWVGVAKWRGVGGHLLGVSVWQGQLYWRRRRDSLGQTSCRCISESLLAYRSRIPPARHRAMNRDSFLVLLFQTVAWTTCASLQTFCNTVQPHGGRLVFLSMSLILQDVTLNHDTKR